MNLKCVTVLLTLWVCSEGVLQPTPSHFEVAIREPGRRPISKRTLTRAPADSKLHHRRRRSVLNCVSNDAWRNVITQVLNSTTCGCPVIIIPCSSDIGNATSSAVATSRKPTAIRNSSDNSNSSNETASGDPMFSNITTADSTRSARNSSRDPMVSTIPTADSASPARTSSSDPIAITVTTDNLTSSDASTQFTDVNVTSSISSTDPSNTTRVCVCENTASNSCNSATDTTAILTEFMKTIGDCSRARAENNVNITIYAPSGSSVDLIRE